MSPATLLFVLLACLLALLPVWRLNVAGWSRGSLFTAWVLYALAIFVGVRFALAARFLLPVLVLAYVAPFVAGPERLNRVFGKRRPAARPVINVTPTTPPGLPGGPHDEDEPDGDERDDDAPGGPAAGRSGRR